MTTWSLHRLCRACHRNARRQKRTQTLCNNRSRMPMMHWRLLTCASVATSVVAKPSRWVRYSNAFAALADPAAHVLQMTCALYCLHAYVHLRVVVCRVI
jgi:hypothetical protein